MTTGHATPMSEAKKVERFRSTKATSFPAIDRKATKLDQASLLVMKLQAELGETLSKFFKTRLRFVLVLKADDKIIRKTQYDDIAATAFASPPLDPKIENIVQVHISKQR
jgi:hypothetical protein